MMATIGATSQGTGAITLRDLDLADLGVTVAPTLQLLCGVWILGEPFVGSQLVGFGLIWLALVLYAADGLRRNRRQKQRPAAVASAWPPTRADVDAPPEPGSEAGRN